MSPPISKEWWVAAALTGAAVPKRPSLARAVGQAAAGKIRSGLGM